MRTVRIISLIIVLALLALSPLSIALAQEPTPTPTKPPAKIDVNPTYPTMQSTAGSTFEFELNLVYNGDAPAVFDLRATGPKDWTITMTPPYEKDKKITSIRLEPSFGTGTKILLQATADFFPFPDPGEYPVHVEAVSGNIKGTTDLKAVITAKYTLQLVPATQLLNTNATAGRDNFFSIKVQNLGTAAVDNINLSSSHPDGWTVVFTPDKVDALQSITEKNIDINIKPPSNTIAGDYSITLKASGKQTAARDLEIRVTVESPTIWGWVGVGIIVIVVVGMGIIFMRFSRR